FAPDASIFQNYRDLMMEFNKTQDADSYKIEYGLSEFLNSIEEVKDSFSSWGNKLLSLGNLAEKLLAYINRKA
ncbi:MAG: hypothetical protein J6W60_09600, partial [Treponema sp.]|nr:hypothetical protein [Treponema sp.]